MTTTRITGTAAQATAAALRLDYLSSDHLASQPASWWQNVLGVVGFEKPPAFDGARVPVTASMTPAWAEEQLCEVGASRGRDGNRIVQRRSYARRRALSILRRSAIRLHHRR